MPRASFSQQYKAAGDVDRFPKYKLGVGEKSRAWMPEPPWMEYYHRIEAPHIENGEVVMEVKQGRNGAYETPKMDWIGNVFCLGRTEMPDGSPGPLVLTGIDAENCPACESAENNTGVRPPEQRFAANIIKYKIKARSYDLAAPVSAEVLVWAYTGRIHGMLYDLGERFGDLSKLDITVELEDTPGADKYQKIKQLSVMPDPAWRDAKVKAYLRELWSHPENRATEEQLRDACLGRDVPRPVMMDMVRRAERQWRDSERGGGSGDGDASAADEGFNGDLAGGIDGLLDDGPANEEAVARVREMKEETRQEVADALSPDSPFADETSAVPAATTTATSAPAAGSRSRTGSKSAKSAGTSDDGPSADAERDQAVQAAADGMFGEGSGGETATAAPTGNGSKAAKPAAAAQPSLDAPEPTAAKSSGNVVNFDELFS